ncbi:MAG: molecular chaperone [uncultured bacterium]|nr:MAG: molecular chaperone [uncultured bacterium]
MDAVSLEEFMKSDIRIGTVVEAVVPEWSHWVMKLTVDFGKEVGKKVCFSGIMKFYEPKDFVGSQFPFIVNLEPKKIGPEKDLSEVMMLMAVPGEDEDIKPILFRLQEKVPNGTKVR